MDTPAHLEAVEAEAVDVAWDGITVTLPASVDEWDPDTLEAFESGKAIAALRSLLGSAKYDALRAEWARQHDRKAKVGDLTRLVEEIARVYGFDGPGE